MPLCFARNHRLVTLDCRSEALRFRKSRFHRYVVACPALHCHPWHFQIGRFISKRLASIAILPQHRQDSNPGFQKRRPAWPFLLPYSIFPEKERNSPYRSAGIPVSEGLLHLLRPVTLPLPEPV